MGKIWFHFSHLRYNEKTACKLSASNGCVNGCSTYKIKTKFHFALVPSCFSCMVSNVL